MPGHVLNNTPKRVGTKKTTKGGEKKNVENSEAPQTTKGTKKKRNVQGVHTVNGGRK